MKKIISYIFTLGAALLVMSCSLDEVENPNAPTFQSFEEGATQADVRLLAVGLEAIMRNDLHFHYQTVSIIGREYYDLTGVDPRFTGELLKGPLDNNGFLTTRAYAAWYKIVQSANLLETAVTNSSANLADTTKAGYIGYAKTLKAYSLMMVANRQEDNGIRVDVNDPDNLGAELAYQPALSEIRTILNEGYNDLTVAGAEFDFVLSSGFDGFDKPATFAEFNRAVAARVAIYQNDKAAARSLLAESFLDLDGDLDVGPKHIFGLTGNDIANAQFYIQDQSGQEFMVHDSWVNDAEAGDKRVTEKSDPFASGRVKFDDLSARNQVWLYKSQVDPVALMRNEELILLYAEANIGSNNNEAVNALNQVRTAAGLDPYAGAVNAAALTDELLRQRRYSLFGEGHRWIDLRRYDRLDQIPLDRPGDEVIRAFPRPITESNTTNN
ncbi:RagB/SusD family nutrient uptake outer membrane protein [Fulvivirga sp. RKSG066]|uniref:RagB/SusD family nutrient uptake outer membrane protein n=1 Tax=Fulvivirga aurantia TaxID=2529383 RepID=UPI0012BD305E|nr:RagB/SusD family nutrient uptake outer membrane protein [Fulvivirga aurantia]MTI20011.1 RagB/SusD family nutrient uptake outer membrane protein [Fulvivirga aurantia]